ncbi:fasciclin-2-like [Ctenocephalides felis]|uniref:fasciclin-2-like n=1 Tax=Ctenocephalides felis TaxID=7515 RepID=UPI000E6E2EE2|nr:fasciclin-2-like [Ctenocephalides felis]
MGPGDNDGMPILGYVCQYKPERELDWRGARNATWSAESSYTIDGLVPETIYHFRFAATNAVGPGPYSNNIAQATPRRSPPEEPKLLVGVSNEVDGGIVTSPYADHYELRWKIPADNGEPIDYYQLRYCPVQRQNGAWAELDSLCNARELRAFETTAHELNDLLADSHYKVELRAHNALGDSPPAQILLKTARGMDSVVRSEGPSLSSSAIVGIAVGAVVLLLLLVDLSCYCVARAGLLAAACHARTKPTDDEEAAKLGRDEQEPLQNGNVKRNTSVEFDGKKARAKTGEIVGKNSAV